MGEFNKEYASKGVAGAGLGTGIAGLSLGVLNSAGGLLGGMFGRNGGCGWGYNNCGYNQDLAFMNELAKRDAEIARLNSKAYSDESDLALYKYFDAKLEAINQRLCQQEVFNTQTNGTLSVVASQLKTQSDLLASITRTAIPESAICDFKSRGCCTTVTQ